MRTDLPPDIHRLLTIAQVAEWLSLPVQTLRAWRVRGKGPRALRLGKHLRYREADVEAWLQENER